MNEDLGYCHRCLVKHQDGRCPDDEPLPVKRLVSRPSVKYAHVAFANRLVEEAQERYPPGSEVPREELLAWLSTRVMHWMAEKAE